MDPSSGVTISRPNDAADRRPRFFASPADEPRSRRASDVLTLVGAVVGLALLGAVARREPGVERRFMGFVASLPRGLLGVWRLLIVGLVIWAVVIVLLTCAARRWAVLRDLVVACGVAVAASLLIARIVSGSWPPIWDSLRSVGPARYFPPLGAAVAIAVVLTASPNLSEPGRRLGRWLILLALVGTTAHLAAAPTGAVAAVLVGLVSAACAHLVFGSCRGRPSLQVVAAALADLGVSAHDLSAAQRQQTGLFVLDATDGVVDDTGPRSQRRLVVKVYGRDANDTQLLTTVWRKVWYREAGSPISFGRVSQVEHEAFLGLLAGQSGIRTQPVVTAGATVHDDVMLVLRDVGQRLAAQPAAWSPGVAVQAWRTLARLHGIGIGHGQVDDEHLILDGDQVGLVDFRGAAVAPTQEALRTDQAQLLVTTALALGVEASLPLAHDALGAQALTSALPFLQLTALTRHQRAAVRAAKLDLDELRAAAAELAGTTPPELQRLQRVTLASLVQIVLLLGAFVAVAAVLGGLDLQGLGDQLQHATLWLLVAAVLLAQLPRLTAAVSVLGASPTPLPLGPVYALQLATSYLNLAVPTSAARFAVTIRFLQRHGMGADTALVVSMLDTLGQTVVQLAILLVLLVLTSATLHLELGGTVPADMTGLVVGVAVVAVLSVVAVGFVGKWRRVIVSFVRRMGRVSWEAIRGLRSPRRLALVLAGNIGTELMFAFTLLALAWSFGYSVGIAGILVITVAVRVLTGVVPIPGGIGVAESGLALGLVRAGMPEETAFAAVLVYRLATFYLPPLWGFFALRWLERNKHL